MPCGRTVIIWAICDECDDCIQQDTDTGSVKDAVGYARLNGWTVSKDGWTTCEACQKEAPND